MNGAFATILGMLGNTVAQEVPKWTGSDTYEDNRQLNQQRRLTHIANQENLGYLEEATKLDLEYNSPLAQRRRLEEAGLSVGLMYGGSGGSQGMNTAKPSGGVQQGGQAANAAQAQTAKAAMTQNALNAAKIESEIKLNESQANKLNAESDNISEETKTEIEIRPHMIQQMRLENKSREYDIIEKHIQRVVDPEEIEQAVRDMENGVLQVTTYGTFIQDDHGDIFNFQWSPTDYLPRKIVRDFNQIAYENDLIQSEKLLNDQRYLGYWTELYIAWLSGDAEQIQAKAKELEAKISTGEKVNWKTIAEVGGKFVGTVISSVLGIKGLKVLMRPGVVKGAVGFKQANEATKTGKKIGFW